MNVTKAHKTASRVGGKLFRQLISGRSPTSTHGIRRAKRRSQRWQFKANLACCYKYKVNNTPERNLTAFQKGESESEKRVKLEQKSDPDNEDEPTDDPPQPEEKQTRLRT